MKVYTGRHFHTLDILSYGWVQRYIAKQAFAAQPQTWQEDDVSSRTQPHTDQCVSHCGILTPPTAIYKRQPPKSVSSSSSSRGETYACADLHVAFRREVQPITTGSTGVHKITTSSQGNRTGSFCFSLVAAEAKQRRTQIPRKPSAAGCSR